MLKRLLYLNGLAALSVITTHANTWAYIAMISWTDRYRAVTVPNYDQVGNLDYYIMFFLRGITGFTIPAFLFVSGFFIAIATGRTQPTIPWKVVFARIKYLFFPYLVWFFIAVLFDLLEGKPNSFIEYLGMIFTGGIRGPYYYVPLLIQLYLLAPFLVSFAKRNWKALLIIAAMIQLLTQVLLYLEMFHFQSNILPFTILPVWLFPTRIFWFAFGIVVGFHLQQIKESILRFKWQLIASTIIFFILTTLEREYIFIANVQIPYETTITSLYALSFILTILGLTDITLPLTNQINDIGSKSFGLYLAHVPAQTYTARILYHISPWLLEYQIPFLIIVFTAGLAIPLLLMEVMRRSPARQYYQYIFG